MSTQAQPIDRVADWRELLDDVRDYARQAGRAETWEARQTLARHVERCAIQARLQIETAHAAYRRKANIAGALARPACATCAAYAGRMAPSHNGSEFCQSGSIASGGTKAHCSCRACF